MTHGLLMDGQVRLAIVASLANLGLAGAVMRALAHEGELDALASSQLELAVVEALTNIIRHGIGEPPQPNLNEIELTVWVLPDCVEVEIVDYGQPIPSDALVKADGSVFFYPVDDVLAWPEGGMGLSLIRAATDYMAYCPGDDQQPNVLLLRKLREPAHENTEQGE